MINKDRRIHYTILIQALAGIAVLFVLLFLRMRMTRPSSSMQQKNGLLSMQPANGVLHAASLEIPVSIANTEASRQQGLSGTAALSVDSGKLFVFDQPGNYGFWMKDMQYGLDFVWIDSAMNIVSITPNVAADTYPQIFYPPQQVTYVLEVNAGFAAKHNLVVGERLSF